MEFPWSDNSIMWHIISNFFYSKIMMMLLDSFQFFFGFQPFFCHCEKQTQFWNDSQIQAISGTKLGINTALQSMIIAKLSQLRISGLALKTGSSGRFQQYPTTFILVSSEVSLTVDQDETGQAKITVMEANLRLTFWL